MCGDEVSTVEDAYGVFADSREGLEEANEAMFIVNLLKK